MFTQVWDVGNQVLFDRVCQLYSAMGVLYVYAQKNFGNGVASRLGNFLM